MTATLATRAETDIDGIMTAIGQAAKAAADALAHASSDAKNTALTQAAAAIRAQKAAILKANAQDLDSARARGLSDALLDRLKLNDQRIDSMARGLDDIAALKDPVGDVMAEWDRPNGLKIARVRTPLGVIGIIYESRPNVTADAGGLCLKAGNAAILRGGSEAVRSNHAIHACLVAGLKAAVLPEAAIQLVPTQDRAAVGRMLKMAGVIDVIVPRGGKSLVERVQSEASVPVFAHLEGICHLYVDKSANLEMARNVALNAKMRRTGVCGAMETLLVDKAVLGTHLTPILDDLMAAGCEVRGDSDCRAVDNRLLAADDADWDTEYLAPILSVKAVDGVGGAIAHIARHSSGHTESIIAEDGKAVARFLNEVNSAIVMHNASTQFADGGEFGMGAEIGISTGKMHARGPVGVEQLTSFKYIVRGHGQARP